MSKQIQCIYKEAVTTCKYIKLLTFFFTEADIENTKMYGGPLQILLMRIRARDAIARESNWEFTTLERHPTQIH
jgi:hypothetical protein